MTRSPILDPVAVAHADLADDAAGRVLHLLDVALDHHLADGDDGSAEGGGRRPDAEAAEQHHHDG